MSESIEREIGALREAVDANTRAVNRLIDKFDLHIREDDKRFAEIGEKLIEQSSARGAHGRWLDTAKTMAMTVFATLTSVGVTHWLGGHG